MAKKTEIRPLLDRLQAQAFVSLLDRELDSHGITVESFLTEKLAKIDGIRLVPVEKNPPTVENRDKKKPYHYNVVAPNGGIICYIGVKHRDWYAKEVEKENLGGSVNDGDWWAFTALTLVECSARALCDYGSPKNGRGGRYADCLHAMHEWAKKLPEPPKKK